MTVKLPSVVPCVCGYNSCCFESEDELCYGEIKLVEEYTLEDGTDHEIHACQGHKNVIHLGAYIPYSGVKNG